jgi:hypothetical protein
MNLTGKYFFHGKSYYKQNKNPNDKLGKIFPTYTMKVNFCEIKRTHRMKKKRFQHIEQ